MIQYAFGDFNSEGYNYKSSAPDFFSDTSRAAQLSHLHQFDTSSLHGCEPGEYHCYLMTSSNLNSPGERERLYFQHSAMGTHRTALFLRGYMSDERDEDLYGRTLLRLMRADIPGLQETNGNLSAVEKSISPRELRLDSSVGRENIPEALLRRCLSTMIVDRNEVKRLYIRLNRSGKEAMRYGRSLLYALYSRLPYEIRERNGFFTGLTAAIRNDSKNTLPAGIRVFLLDADSDIRLGGSDMINECIDLANPVSAPKESGHYGELIDFLINGSEEERAAFFRDVADMAQESRRTGQLQLNKELYGFVYFLYTQRGKQLSETELLAIAKEVEKKDHRSSDYSFMHALMLKWIPFESIEEAYLSPVPYFSKLWDLGSRQDVLWQLLDSFYQGLGAEARKARENQLYTSLCELYLARLNEEHPCLFEKKPTAQDVKASAQIRTAAPESQSNAMLRQLWYKFNECIMQQRARVDELYRKNRKEQLQQGVTLIKGLSELRSSKWEKCLDALQNKERFYLGSELLGASGEWHIGLSERLFTLLREEMGRKAFDPFTLAEELEGVHLLLSDRSFLLSAEQEREYDNQLELLKKICTALRMPRNTLEEKINSWQALPSSYQDSFFSAIFTQDSVFTDGLLDDTDALLPLLEQTENRSLFARLFTGADCWRFHEEWTIEEAAEQCNKISRLAAAGLGGQQLTIDRVFRFRADELARLLPFLCTGRPLTGELEDQLERLVRGSSQLSEWLSREAGDMVELCKLLLRLKPENAPLYNDRLSFTDIRGYLPYLNGEQLSKRYTEYMHERFPSPDVIYLFLSAGLSIPELLTLTPKENRIMVQNCFGSNEPIVLHSPRVGIDGSASVSTALLLLPLLAALGMGLTLFWTEGLLPAAITGVALLLVFAFCLFFAGGNSESSRRLARLLGFSLLPGLLTAVGKIVLCVFKI